MTLAAAPEALQGAVAAGILGCGSVILGAAEAAGRLLADIIARSNGSTIDDAAVAIVREYQADKRAVPGYGHPLHKGYDPRARQLLQLAEQVGTSGAHMAAARAIDRVLPEVTG